MHICSPLPNNIVQPSAICGGVKDETHISNGKTFLEKTILLFILSIVESLKLKVVSLD